MTKDRFIDKRTGFLVGAVQCSERVLGRPIRIGKNLVMPHFGDWAVTWPDGVQSLVNPDEFREHFLLVEPTDFSIANSCVVGEVIESLHGSWVYRLIPTWKSKEESVRIGMYNGNADIINVGSDHALDLKPGDRLKITIEKEGGE